MQHNRPRPTREEFNEIAEMSKMLKASGYTAARGYATRLYREGMGSEELRERMRVPYGAPGSLNYTHGFVKR